MRAKWRGFTLVELMIVITIIGILIAFILRAAVGGIRRAEHSATVGLIAKLESALTDRIDALTSLRADPTWCHQWLAGIWTVPPSATVLAPQMPSNQRAQVIAQFDYLRAELPDVFVLDTGDDYYKLNFGALPFNPAPGITTLFNDWRDYRLPLGAGVSNPANVTDVPNVTGMKGASFAAAGAIYKQLGFLPAGYDGADNNNDGAIDNWIEGTGGDATLAASILAKLANHKHKTARAEMLYAVLVEGTGPLGSVFNKDDFNDQEVKDTDGDGLLEFVDAYGEPLQFYRWPILYRSDSQKGFPDMPKIVQDTAAGAPIGPYSTVFESREQDPMDPNQTLLSPGWWGAFNAQYPWGSARNNFALLFHLVVDPLAAAGTTTGFSTSNATINTYWDRSALASKALYSRRAYYSRFLVLSGGPDKVPGTAQLGVDYRVLDERGAFPLANGSTAGGRDTSGAPVALNVTNVLTIENQAGKIDPNRTNNCPPMNAGRNDTNTLLEEFSGDDISNHNLHVLGGPLSSGGPG